MRRLVPLALIAALASALAAGCGGVSLDPVAQAATKTSAVGSFRFDYTLSVAGYALNGSGAYDEPDKRLEMRFELPAAPQLPSGGTMDMVLDSSSSPVAYLRMPLASAFVPNGKSWIELDLGKAAKAHGVDLSQLGQLTQADPSQTLGLLKHVGSSQVLGRERVNGAETTHYRVTIDGQKLVDAQPTDTAKQAVRQALAQAGIDSFPVDVWIGDDGLLRRLQLDLPQAGGTKLTEDLTGFGQDVTVDLPPAAEVFVAPVS